MSKYESDIWRNNIINTMPGPRWCGVVVIKYVISLTIEDQATSNKYT